MNILHACRVLLWAGLLATWVDASAASRPITPEYRAAIERAERLGTTLYVHDSAAWRATDELVRRHLLPKDRRVRGWITAMSDTSDAVIVTFVGELHGAPHALYRVSVPAGDGKLEFAALKPARPLTEGERASFAARSLAMDALGREQQRCADQYNTVVLPIRDGDEPVILVYLLAATAEPDVVVAGGHLRFAISPDGATIEEQRAFTKSCLVVSTKIVPDREDVKGMMLTHLLDPTPTEIHVFLSRTYHRPFFIATAENNLLWKVDGSTIELVDTGEK
jgi:hypothetical protein